MFGLRPEALSLEGSLSVTYPHPPFVRLGAQKPLLYAPSALFMCILYAHSIISTRSHYGLVTGFLEGSSSSVRRPMFGG